MAIGGCDRRGLVDSLVPNDGCSDDWAETEAGAEQVEGMLKLPLALAVGKESGIVGLLEGVVSALLAETAREAQ